VVNDATSLALFSTANVAFGSGTEPGSSALIGPGLAGLIMMTPSIPDSGPPCNCEGENAADIVISIKTVETVVSFITEIYQRRGLPANDRNQCNSSQKIFYRSQR
jgi:hypothetical protein